MSYTAIDKGSLYQNQVLYTGDDSTQAITGVGFQPDLWWNKSRSGTHSAGVHCLYDAVRGTTKRLQSNATTAEATVSGVTAFGADGVTLGSENQSNGGSTNYVGWNWLAGNSTSTNEDGSVNSTVSVNTTSGFSIAKFVGTGSALTTGHGLGSVPKMIIARNIDEGANWNVYHSSLGNTKAVYLNTTDAETTSSSWNDTTPTSSLVSIGAVGDVNTSTKNIILYCFAEKQGYSKISSYPGNGNADGTFINTGFRPAWVCIKHSNSAGDYWQISDNKRDPYNGVYHRLFPNVVDAEATGLNPNIEFLSNGFKCRTASSATNAVGTYVYAAFAENPLVTSTGIPATAR